MSWGLTKQRGGGRHGTRVGTVGEGRFCIPHVSVFCLWVSNTQLFKNVNTKWFLFLSLLCCLKKNKNKTEHLGERLNKLATLAVNPHTPGGNSLLEKWLPEDPPRLRPHLLLGTVRPLVRGRFSSHLPQGGASCPPVRWLQTPHPEPEV